jgi:putative ubiquitin-RnfH superfamily antitoxin RatB of RatAB toxin-antitoxin module
MTTKLVNGERVEMAAQEVADLEASRKPNIEKLRKRKLEDIKSLSNEKMLAQIHFEREATLVQAVNVASSVEAIENIDIDSGWPAE